jgi:iron complex outermembrane receptor protein
MPTSAPKSQSQNFSLPSDTATLNRMVVIASRIKEYSPSKVTLYAKDFSGKYIDLQSVLETISGVAITTIGGFGHYSDVSIHGSSASQVQVYLDGIPLNGATGCAVDISKIPFSSLQTISIYKATPPIELFGDNAGGVINLTTGANKDATTASTEIGSFGYREGSVLISKTMGPMVHRLSINYGRADNDYPYTDSVITFGPTVSTDDSVKKMDNNYYSTFSSAYSNTYTISNHNKLTSQFSAITTDEGIFYRSMAGSNDGNIRNSKLSLVESYSATFDSILSMTINAKGKIENEQFRRFQRFYLTPPSGGAILHDISQPYGSLESIIKANYRDNFILTGLLSASYNGFNYDNLFWPAGQVRPKYFRITEKTGLEADLNLGKNISARVGGIYRFEIDSTNDSITSYGLPVAKGGITKNGFPAGFSELRCKLFDGIDLLASFQYSGRSPGFSEKYSEGSNVSGNPALRPETRLEYGVGFSFLYPNLALSSSIFSSTTKDKIIYTMNAARMFIPKNVSDVNGLGLENDAALTPFPWVSIVNSFTFMENIVHSDLYSSWSGRDEPLQPRFIDNINIKFTYKNWYASHSAHFSSRYFTDFDNTDSVRIKPQLNACVGYMFSDHFDFSYRVENYLNAQDYDFQRPLPGLSQYVVLKCNL